jgi:glutamate-1-semialdehyde 2,1-aminomutase
MDSLVQLRNSSLESDIAEAHERYAVRRPRSAAMHASACEVMPAGNTRSNLSYRPFPTAMARGEDCRLWDVDGNQYLDLCGEYTAGLFGHTEARIHDALRGALANGLSLAAVGQAEQDLARLLCARFPSLERVRFSNSGTEANLLAITAARAFTGRSHVLVFRGGYHGSVLTFPLAGPAPVTAPFPVIFADYNDTEGTVATIRAHSGSLAAVLIEPMVGGGGCIVAAPAFMAALRAATREAGILLIFDEVMTSRMSGGGQQARLGITPDMTTMGKYVAGGMSFGAFGGRADVMAQFETALPHAGTFNNNVMSMAAGRVAMGEIFTPEVANSFFERGERLRGRLNVACAAGGTTMHFSGLGSMVYVHFRAGPVIRPYAPTPLEDGLRELFFFDMLEAGMYLARRGMAALSLPTREADLGRFVDAVSAFVQARAGLLRELPAGAG